jgi:hypothetical protein
VRGSVNRLFLRLLGAVYLVAFASLAVQITALVGERGIMPAGEYLEWAYSMYGPTAYGLLPTVLWLNTSDLALKLVTGCGVLLSLLLLIGVTPRLTLFLLWLLYLSLSVAGQDFLSFQWDALLLETSLLAILWAPATRLLGREEQPPSELARFLLVFLLFKLMFLSGITKLLSGDPTWRRLTALDYHFETQPLPPWTAWYAHQVPHGIHAGLTLVTLLVETLVPWLLLLPARFRRTRLGAVAAIALLQLGIAATGNYGFFNFLALVLCVPVLDDDLLVRLRISRPAAESEARTPATPGVVRVIAPVVLALSVLSMVREIAYTLPNGRGMAFWPRQAESLMGMIAPLRSISGYGLFRVMTTERPELVIEGSRDGERWEPYELRYKPGAVDRRPGFVAPFHPRLDWQLWFAALSPRASYPWLQVLARRLRDGEPEVLGLFAVNPFGREPPKLVRAVLYDYRFSTVEERRRAGAWWVREPLGIMPFDTSR